MIEISYDSLDSIELVNRFLKELETLVVKFGGEFGKDFPPKSRIILYGKYVEINAVMSFTKDSLHKCIAQLNGQEG